MSDLKRSKFHTLASSPTLTSTYTAHFCFQNLNIMATLKDLPNELIHLVIPHIAQLSYRDRARMACVGKECRRTADSPVDYKAQYIRDFAYPPQDHIINSTDTYPLGMFHTSAGSGSDPPNRWTGFDKGPEYEGQESSWRRAYVRRHNPDFPQNLHTGLPAVPYNNKLRDMLYKHRLQTAQSTEIRLAYLYGLQLKPPPRRSKLLINSTWHGVCPRVEARLRTRGLLLCWGPLEPIKTRTWTPKMSPSLFVSIMDHTPL